jgi:signal transduction histidine kinase
VEPSDRTLDVPTVVGQPKNGSGLSLEAVANRLRDLIRPPRTHPAELISSLNEVAYAVSSAMSVSDMLEVIVDRAKLITDTDKAVLVLSDDHGDGLDLETIVVRGRREQHEQQWWETRLDPLSEKVFETGTPASEVHADQEAILLCSPVLVKDRPIGVLCAINTEDRPFTEEQVDFLAIVSTFAASAIENARLAEQSRYVLLASERDRIAREMHDGVVQSLFSISLGLEVCKKQVLRDPTAVAERLDELQQHLNTSMGELRRFIYDLRPMKLTELGLVGATEYWIREVTLGRPVRGAVSVEGDLPRLSPSQEASLYRVTKEAVSNVIRHSGAQTFSVGFSFEPGWAHVAITDDGHGFDAQKVVDGDTEQIGLRSIRHRIDREGGRFLIDSAPGRGTTVSVDLPLERTR